MLFYRFHASGNINLHRTLHLQGTCWRTAAGKIAKGTHQIAIALAADGDSYSGMSCIEQLPCRTVIQPPPSAYIGLNRAMLPAKQAGWPTRESASRKSRPRKTKSCRLWYGFLVCYINSMASGQAVTRVFFLTSSATVPFKELDERAGAHVKISECHNIHSTVLNLA